MISAVERFQELRRTERMFFPHATTTHEEACRLSLAASLQQVLEVAEAERRAGREHADTTELEVLAADLQAQNRRGRPPRAASAPSPVLTLEERQSIISDAAGSLRNRNQRRRFHRQLKRKGIQ